jgi:hypothetical protein
MVMGFVGSRRPALIHSWMRLRLIGLISTEKLLSSQSADCFLALLPCVCVYSLVHLASLSGYHDIWCLTTIESERHFTVLLLTLVTSSGRLALA